MLYILLFKQNFLDRLILLMLLTILAFHMGINFLSKKRTLSSSSSYKVRVLLSRKEKKKNNQDKKDGNTHQADEKRDQNDNSSNIY